jgi:hypothetical protein
MEHTWTTSPVTSMGTARRNLTGAGTQTSSFAAVWFYNSIYNSRQPKNTTSQQVSSQVQRGLVVVI